MSNTTTLTRSILTRRITEKVQLETADDGRIVIYAESHADAVRIAERFERLVDDVQQYGTIVVLHPGHQN